MSCLYVELLIINTFRLRVSNGKRIRIYIRDFEVLYCLDCTLHSYYLLQTESCCDKLYITWEICDYGFFSYNYILKGTPGTPVSEVN